MKEALGKFLATPLGSFVRVVVGFVVAAAIASVQAGGLSEVSTLDWWQSTLAVALGAAFPILLAWLNPQDPRFGKVAEPPAE